MSEPATPYLRLDVPILRRNLRRAAERARAGGFVLRPHAKTHKCVEIARLQLEAGAVGLTVATIGEAEVFADAGFDDLFIAYPLWLDDGKRERLTALAERARIRVGADSAEAARRFAGLGVQLLVEIDSGMHRSGIAPERAADVATAAREAGVDVAGVFTFPGHSYSPGQPAPVATQEAAALASARDNLRAAGFECPVVSGGSTPSFAHISGVTEARPGVYCVGDAQQWELGTCGPGDIALTCVATVVSHHTGPDGDARFVCDAGSKVLAADRPAWASGHGRLPDTPDARVVALSEHHATIAWPASCGPLPALGEQVRIAPNHACNAINLVDELWAVDTDHARAWPVAARGRNS